MSPDEVIEKLKKLGVDMSRQTLTRYERQGLIPIPKRGGTGRGGGRWTDYPNETVVEAYASCSLIHGNYAVEELAPVFDGKPPRVSPYVTNLARLLYFARIRKQKANDEFFKALETIEFRKMEEFNRQEAAEFPEFTEEQRLQSERKFRENLLSAIEEMPLEVKKESHSADDAYDEIILSMPGKAQSFLVWLCDVWGDELDKANVLLETLE